MVAYNNVLRKDVIDVDSDEELQPRDVTRNPWMIRADMPMMQPQKRGTLYSDKTFSFKRSC